MVYTYGFYFKVFFICFKSTVACNLTLFLVQAARMAQMESDSEDDKPLSFRKKPKKEIKKKRKKQDSDFEDEEDEEDFKQVQFILILHFF